MAVREFLDSLPSRPLWWKTRQDEMDQQMPMELTERYQQRLPSTASRIDLKLGQHWLILGMTGTGKTYFSKMLVGSLHSLSAAPIYILDTKQDPEDFGKYPGRHESDEPPDPIQSGIQVWQPPMDDFAAYDEWFGNIMQSHKAWQLPAVVYVDEIDNITKGVSQPVVPRNFTLMMKQGRSFGITVVALTQELARIARQVKTQTRHIIRFRLNEGMYDSQKGNRLVHRPPNAPEPKAKFGFIYANTEKTDWHEYRSAEHFF